MFYENMPLYPGMKPGPSAEGCMRVRLFEDGCGCRPPAMRECERVTVENPCRPGERAEVTLGVDDCGSLVICVHRAPCPPAPGCRRPRCLLPPPGESGCCLPLPRPHRPGRCHGPYRRPAPCRCATPDWDL